MLSLRAILMGQNLDRGASVRLGSTGSPLGGPKQTRLSGTAGLSWPPQYL